MEPNEAKQTSNEAIQMCNKENQMSDEANQMLNGILLKGYVSKALPMSWNDKQLKLSDCN